MQGNLRVGPTGSEIDLVELMRGLWARKLLIAGVTLVGTLLGLLYILVVTPVYEAQGLVIPPTQHSIAELNNGRSEAGLPVFTVTAVYDVFTRNLRSEILRRRFFEEQYLPSLSAEERKKSVGLLYSDFSKALGVALVDKNVSDRYSVIVRYPDPVIAEKWAQLYIEQAGAVAHQEVVDNAMREAEVRAKNLAQQINTLRETGRRVREDSVIRLREALRIANAIGLREPPMVPNKISNEVSSDMEGDLTFMRGSKALEAELKNLEDRQSDDPFIDGLRKLQANYAFYKNLEIDGNKLKVFRFDGPVDVSDAPVKPKRALSVLGGALIGLIVGLLIACGVLLLASPAPATRET
ncbi:LPS O-antigen chain length determinant protein WzzB [Pseudomonas akapageensis]|uniref:LPS O-antigen chain length determinant protein WzzB n=1 Tax=Pseudomonas akapageensis TaxID=2609961 RepID=UPI00140D117D|nr:Wzz/FepE/Etk N-terminal domain-containing protein [Pseudomonas akapageensis]